MKKIGIVSLLCLILAVGSVQAASQADLVKPLQDYVDNLTTFSADFVQVQPDESTFAMHESKGHFDLKRPGKLYWHYDTPDPQTIIIDGVNLWVYDEDLDQVSVQPIKEIKKEIPLGWLLFDEPIVKRFEIIYSRESDGVEWFNLSPKVATYFQSLDVGMKEGRMISVIMYQGSDNVTKLTFHRIQENHLLTDSYFQFIPPSGVDVIGAPE